VVDMTQFMHAAHEDRDHERRDKEEEPETDSAMLHSLASCHTLSTQEICSILTNLSGCDILASV